MTDINHQQEEFFIVFSDDWGEHPSSCQHLFKIIGKEHKVLWVNTIGMRNMKLSWQDINKALRKIYKMLFGGDKGFKKEIILPEKLVVIQPLMLPFANSKIIRNLNNFSVIKSVNNKAAAISTKKPITVATVPNACDYVRKLNEKKIIYYCVDDFSLWPGLEKDLVAKMEEKLVKNSDCFFATSTKLFERLKKTAKPTTLLTHGVDVEHFSNLPDQEHEVLSNIPKPRVGYFGLFDERNDQELIIKVANALPDVSFVVTGNIKVNISKLDELPNVFFTGPVNYDELPRVITGWDICILPYVINELTNSISPLKLKEYLTTGKEVICTPLPEIKKIQDNIFISDDPEYWTEFIKEHLTLSKGTTNNISSFYRNQSWNEKARILLNEIL